MRETQVQSLGQEDPWQPTPVFLPGESHGQRNLVSYSPWDHRVERELQKVALNYPFPSQITMYIKIVNDSIP